MVGLSWNYTRCLSSMVHLIVAWLLLLSHWKCSHRKCAWEAMYVEYVSFKLNKIWSHLIDCLNKEIMTLLQRHIPIKGVCHFIFLWFRWLGSTVDEVFVECEINPQGKIQDLLRGRRPIEFKAGFEILLIDREWITTIHTSVIYQAQGPTSYVYNKGQGLQKLSVITSSTPKLYSHPREQHTCNTQWWPRLTAQ